MTRRIRTHRYNITGNSGSGDDKAFNSILKMENIPIAIGFIFAASACASTCYSYGFFTALNIPFGNSPISVVDFTKDIATLFPYFAVGILFIVSILYAIENTVLEGIVTRIIIGNHKSTKNLNNFLTRRHYFILIIDIIMLVVSLMYFLRTKNYAIIIGGVCFIVLSIGSILIDHYYHISGRRNSYRARRLILFVFIPLIISYFCGDIAAIFQIKYSPAVVIIKQDGPISGKVIANYDRGILSYVQGHVIFIRWDEIKYINYGAPYQPPKILKRN